jgi:hypothetical protein
LKVVGVWTPVLILMIGTGVPAPGPATALAADDRAIVVRVTSAVELQAAVERLESHSTVLIAPGEYMLRVPLHIDRVSDVVISGDTDRASDVVLRSALTYVGPDFSPASGSYVAPNLSSGADAVTPNRRATTQSAPAQDAAGAFLVIDGPRITIANLALHGFAGEAIAFGPRGLAPHVFNVDFVDNTGGSIAARGGSDLAGGTIESSRFLDTWQSARTATPSVLIESGRGWRVRRNLFRDERPPRTSAGAALVIRGGADPVVEANTFLDCRQEVVLEPRNPEGAGPARALVVNNAAYRARGVEGAAAIVVTAYPVHGSSTTARSSTATRERR